MELVGVPTGGDPMFTLTVQLNKVLQLYAQAFKTTTGIPKGDIVLAST